jgi:hypothetical protein
MVFIAAKITTDRRIKWNKRVISRRNDEKSSGFSLE